MKVHNQGSNFFRLQAFQMVSDMTAVFTSNSK